MGGRHEAMKTPPSQRRKDEIVAAKLKFAIIFTFVVGLLMFVIGVALLAIFSRNKKQRHDYDAGKAMVYAGVASLIVGVMVLLVCAVLCVVSFLRFRRQKQDGDEGRSIRVAKYAPSSESTFVQDDSGMIYKPRHGSTAPLAMSTPTARSPAPSLSIAPPPFAQRHPVQFQQTHPVQFQQTHPVKFQQTDI